MHRTRNPVPTTRDVVPGAGVNIVLKQDQPTGRTVSGLVRDVLTRGNHPRGIKVRLADGRVGRVQSIASGEVRSAPADGAGGEAALGVAGGVPAAVWGGDDAHSFRDRRGRGRRGEGGEGEEDVPSLQIGLDAYIKPAKPKGRRRANVADVADGGPDVDGGSSEQTGFGEIVGYEQPREGTARCPVCDDFEGDEAAVAHHVACHFGDA